MRVLRVEHNGFSYYGSLRDDGFVTPLEDYPDMERVAFSDVNVLPLVAPSKIVCIGLNYKAHVAESDYDLPIRPSFFLKSPASIIGHREKIMRPAGIGRIDHEAELALVIGKKCRNLTPENALDAIFGITCANDVTAREIQRTDALIGRCKSYDTFCPIGPWIETDLPDLNHLTIQCLVNGEVRQSGSTENMIFDPVTLLCSISAVMTLFPGDLVLTGTPSGVSEILPGDEVVVDISGIGRLVNTVE